MKHLFVLLTAAVAIAISAAAQVPPTLFDREKNALNRVSGSDDSAITNVRILPNPASGLIVLMVDSKNSDGFAEGEAVIYSNGGYPVAKRPFTTGTNDIYVNNLKGGLYFLRLIDKSGQIVVKEFVVTR